LINNYSTNEEIITNKKYDELIDSLSINEIEKQINTTDILIETKAAGLSLVTTKW
jgi:hypothetical protein